MSLSIETSKEIMAEFRSSVEEAEAVRVLSDHYGLVKDVRTLSPASELMQDIRAAIGFEKFGVNPFAAITEQRSIEWPDFLQGLVRPDVSSERVFLTFAQFAKRTRKAAIYHHANTANSEYFRELRKMEQMPYSEYVEYVSRYGINGESISGTNPGLAFYQPRRNALDAVVDGANQDDRLFFLKDRVTPPEHRLIGAVSSDQEQGRKEVFRVLNTRFMWLETSQLLIANSQLQLSLWRPSHHESLIPL